jgi:hypothetical protein
MVEVCIAGKCNIPYLSYNATGSSENLCEYYMEIKTILLNALTKLSAAKGALHFCREKLGE